MWIIIKLIEMVGKRMVYMNFINLNWKPTCKRKQKKKAKNDKSARVNHLEEEQDLRLDQDHVTEIVARVDDLIQLALVAVVVLLQVAQDHALDHLLNNQWRGIRLLWGNLDVDRPLRRRIHRSRQLLALISALIRLIKVISCCKKWDILVVV